MIVWGEEELPNSMQSIQGAYYNQPDCNSDLSSRMVKLVESMYVVTNKHFFFIDAQQHKILLNNLFSIGVSCFYHPVVITIEKI